MGEPVAERVAVLEARVDGMDARLMQMCHVLDRLYTMFWAMVALSFGALVATVFKMFLH